jgi:hypothetical protein
MRKSIQKVARALRIGQIPQAIRRQLEADGAILCSHEGIPITVRLKDFRAPGIFCGLRLMAFIGFFAASERRLVVSAAFVHKVWINVSYDDQRLRGMRLKADGGRLSMDFNAEGLIPRATGDVTLRLRVPNAVQIARLLESKGAEVLCA